MVETLCATTECLVGSRTLVANRDKSRRPSLGALHNVALICRELSHSHHCLLVCADSMGIRQTS